VASIPFISRYAGLLLIAAIMALLAVIGGFVFYQAIFSPVWHEKLPVLNTTGQPIMILDYRNATDPTYENLIKFLISDRTEYDDYVMPDYTCADFAARLHDDAEAKGIRCGIVSVVLNTSGFESAWLNANNSLYLDQYFSDSPDKGHALVVFNTTDRGPVYVDSTGISAAEKAGGILPHDMIVYLSGGLELGDLWIDQASGRFDYEFYRQQKELYQSYSTRVTAFNDAVAAYNIAIEAFNEKYAAYSRNVTAYAAESDRYRLQLEDYNEQMSAHNSALAMQNDPIPPAPSGGDALEQRRLNLMDRLNELDRQGTDLQRQQAALDARREGLIARKNALLADSAAGLVIGRPMGIVESISVYW
jgi:hypothetical protein